jgi:glucose-6-phosphate isomerase
MADFFLGTTHQNGENIPKDHTKFTKRPKNIPKYQKYTKKTLSIQKTAKYTKTPQNVPKVQKYTNRPQNIPNIPEMLVLNENTITKPSCFL